MKTKPMLRNVSSRSWRVVAALLLSGAVNWSGAMGARAQDGPKVLKPRVYVGVHQTWRTYSPTTKKWQDNYTSWMPSVKFTVQGPVPGGSQFFVEFTKPNGALWWRMDCPTEEIKADQYDTIETARDTSEAAEKKYTNGIGVFGFKIRMKNELSGQNSVLYSGKFKVGKHSNFNGTPITKNQWDYYVDHDWTLPIGYLWFEEDDVIKSSRLRGSMWFKGDTNGSSLAAYVMYKGKQIGSTKDQGSMSTVQAEVNTVTNDKGDPSWKLWDIEWYNIARTALDPENPNEKIHYLDKNPGEYEIKVLRSGKLARQAKFTVGEDGKIVDPGIVAANNLNYDRMVIPVKVVGTTDGKYVPTAWKTSAFYGGPLKGFNP